jgi:hypothetical protein
MHPTAAGTIAGLFDRFEQTRRNGGGEERAARNLAGD